MKSNPARILSGVALVGVGVLAGLVLSVRVDFGPAVAQENVAQADTQMAVVPGLETSPFVAVADRVVPGVVAIRTRAASRDDRGQTFHPWGDMFDDLFPNDPRREAPTPRPRRQEGSGSGFFMPVESYMSGEGYVLTNNHVINNAEQVVVILSDGAELDARIVGQDPETDVAVLQVDPDDYEGTLPHLGFGNSEDIRVGDWAVAIGNPFGQLAGTLTVGVISAKGRDDLNIMGGGPAYQNFIQTDASINFGNSGGPLVNIRGDVIGMNTAINPAGQGIGFAIPINMVSKIAEQLVQDGRVVRGYLGIYPQELTPEIAESFDIAGTEGILIGQVVENTPAEKGGLRNGDVITRLNGRSVTDVNDFRILIADQPVGDAIRLDILRDGKKRQIDVVLEERPGSPVASSGRDDSDEVWAGLRVEDLDSRQARRMMDELEEEGVLVVDVAADSPAEDAGIRVGDVIKEIGNVEILDTADFNTAVAKYEEKKALAILLKRGNSTLYVGLKP